MDIGAINKGKGKSKYKGKGKKGNKGKGYGQQGHGNTGQGKGKGTMRQTANTKDTKVLDKEKEKDKERQSGKEKDTQQAATDVVNQATRQRTAELQFTTFRKTSMKVTMMQPINGMAYKPPMTTIGGQMRKRKLMQCSNHNNVHCQHPHN